MSRKPARKRPQFTPYERRVVSLAPDHGWRATPGYKVCVIARGDLRFEYPESWVAVPGPTSIKLYDKPHPDDDMVLEVSCIRTPPVDWGKFPPLEDVLLNGLREHGRLLPADSVRRVDIPGLHLVWTEYDDTDANTGKPVIWRQAQCHPGPVYSGPGLLGVLTFGFYQDHFERADPVWEHLLPTIVMGEYIADPTVGPRLN